jgi:GNAT superfamily N-acetyltransferase
MATWTRPRRSVTVHSITAGRFAPVFRSPVHVRDASSDDVASLVEVWGTSGRGTDHEGSPPDLQRAAESVERIAAAPDQRLLVGCIDDRVAGAVHLTRGPLTPIHGDTAVYVGHLQVMDSFRRHGVGRALIEAAVTWAEEENTPHVLAAAAVTSRDANRFMARLGFAQLAVIRGATVAALRAKMPVEPPAVARLGTRSHRSVGQVLVQRRSLRRSQARPS